MDSYANLGSYALLIFEQTTSDLLESLTLSLASIFLSTKLSAKIYTVSIPLKRYTFAQKDTRNIRFYS